MHKKLHWAEFVLLSRAVLYLYPHYWISSYFQCP